MGEGMRDAIWRRERERERETKTYKVFHVNVIVLGSAGKKSVVLFATWQCIADSSISSFCHK
jgi:hypothetical protein